MLAARVLVVDDHLVAPGATKAVAVERRAKAWTILMVVLAFAWYVAIAKSEDH